MAKSLSKRATDCPSFERKEILNKNHYFDNEQVERLMYRYVEGACTNVKLRNEIMEHASELIRQLIKAHNLNQICPGRDDTSSGGDLFQTAWGQVESALYKYEARPHCAVCYNNLRPNDSLLIDQFMFINQVLRKIKRCPRCGVRVIRGNIYYRGKSKVFNLWCINPNSLLLTDKGMIEIGSIGSKKLGDCDLKAFGPNGPNQVIKYVKFQKRPTIKITTKFCYNVEATLDHYLPVLRTGGTKKTKIKDLQIGDLLGIQYDQQYFGNDNKIDYRIVGKYKWPCEFPNCWTEELAYIIGLVVSEGSISRFVSICNTDKEVEKRLQNNSYGLRFERKAPALIVCKNRQLREFVEWLGLPSGTRAWNKFIPSQIMKCSRKIIIAFLRGLFDGDGHSSRHNGVVGYTSTSLRLINQLRVVLLNFGIIARTSIDRRKISHFKIKGYTSTNKHTTYQLILSATDSALYYKRIGFGIAYKQNKRKKLTKNPFRFTDVETTKCLQRLLKPEHYRPLLDSTGYSKHLLLRKKNITVPTLVQVMECLSLDDRYLAARLKDYCDDGPKILWLPIMSLEPGESPTVDIEVPASGSFTANGIISMNSQISRTVALAYIKKENRDRKNSTVFRSHLAAKPIGKSYVLERFIEEARDVFRYNDEYIKVIEALEELYNEDDKPYDGLISKLVDKTNYSRITITTFFKTLRLRSKDFTDSPINEENESMGDRMQMDFEEQD